MRVALAEHDFLLRAALTALIGQAPRLELVAVVRDGDELHDAVGQTAPDVVVCDLQLPSTMNEGAVRIARELRVTHPAVGVVVLSGSRDPRHLLELLRSGSHRRGYLLREHVRSGPQLTSAIEAVGAGGSVVDPEMVQSLLHRRVVERSRLATLTPLEHEILVDMAGGASNLAIARSRGLGRRTVERHVGSIFAKLELPGTPEVSRRVQAVLRFMAEAGEAPSPASRTGTSARR